MKKWRVDAEVITYAYMIVEAETIEEAIQIAEDADQSEFIITEDGDWETLMPIELKDK